MQSFGRKSIRLKGFDYSHPGEYFVTICTQDRVCTLGSIVEGFMELSEAGIIVDSCWKEIPEHFENTRVNVYQIMPNHLHGIVEIKEKPLQVHPQAKPVGVEYIQPLQRSRGDNLLKKQHRYQHVIPKSLGSIIRSFKAAVKRKVHHDKQSAHARFWQRDFYDHIIRSDIDHYFTQQYIELNPLLWHLDSDNLDVHDTPIDNLRRILKERHRLEDAAITYLIDCEMDYREWQESQLGN